MGLIANTGGGGGGGGWKEHLGTTENYRHSLRAFGLIIGLIKLTQVKYYIILSLRKTKFCSTLGFLSKPKLYKRRLKNYF